LGKRFQVSAEVAADVTMNVKARLENDGTV
jgi:hypothetical protein